MNEKKGKFVTRRAVCNGCGLQVQLLQTAVEEATEQKISMTSAVYDVVRL